MARKKATPRRAAAPPAADRFAMAAAVSDRVRIDDIRVVRCSAELVDEDALDDLTLRLVNGYSVAYRFDPDASRLQVRPRFELKGVARDESAPVLNVSAEFVLVYGVASADGLTEANFDAFAELNGVFNAWPYWREFVQNAFARMGLPRLVVPVFRFGD